MSRFKSFYQNDGSYVFLDLSEVVSISGPFKNYPEGKWWTKGRDCYYVRYVLRSGASDIINCWCEDLANNYLKIIARDA